jgi:hypothetical protein
MLYNYTCLRVKALSRALRAFTSVLDLKKLVSQPHQRNLAIKLTRVEHKQFELIGQGSRIFLKLYMLTIILVN